MWIAQVGNERALEGSTSCIDELTNNGKSKVVEVLPLQGVFIWDAIYFLLSICFDSLKKTMHVDTEEIEFPIKMPWNQ